MKQYIVEVHVFDKGYNTVDRHYRVNAEKPEEAARAAENQARIDYQNVVFATATNIEQVG